MMKMYRIHKFRDEINEICQKNGYNLFGDVKYCNIDDNQWTFAVKTPDKIFLVKLIVPFGYYNTGICINSSEYISAFATIFGMRGLFGSINIPISRKYNFKLPESAFDFNKDELEKIYLIYPRCTHFFLRESDKQFLTSFRVGLKIGDISIHDGASFTYLLNHPNEVRKFAEFGE